MQKSDLYLGNICHLSSGSFRAHPAGTAGWETGIGGEDLIWSKRIRWGKTSLSTVTGSHSTHTLKMEAAPPLKNPSAPKRHSGQASALPAPFCWDLSYRWARQVVLDDISIVPWTHTWGPATQPGLRSSLHTFSRLQGWAQPWRLTSRIQSTASGIITAFTTPWTVTCPTLVILTCVHTHLHFRSTGLFQPLEGNLRRGPRYRANRALQTLCQ